MPLGVVTNPAGRPARKTACGHVNRKHYANGNCRSCYDALKHAAHPEQRQVHARRAYVKNPELFKARASAWIANNPIKYALTTARHTARIRDLDFNLDEEYLRSIWIAVCPILGLTLKRVPGKRDSSPSVDRIDSERGYIKGNVQIISTRANRIKNDATVEELEQIAAYLRKLERLRDEMAAE